MQDLPEEPLTGGNVSKGVWLIVGVQAAGKSTIADLLAQRFETGVHIRGGQFYRWAVRGWVHFGDDDSDEARRLLDLRYRLSAQVADEYCASGFSTVVQDNIFGEDVVTWLRAVATRPRYLVVLRPSTEVVAAREEARHVATGKTAYREGELSIKDLDALLEATPKLGLWLDTSAQTPEETVSAILARCTEAIVDQVL